MRDANGHTRLTAQALNSAINTRLKLKSAVAAFLYGSLRFHSAIRDDGSEQSAD